MTEDEIPVEFNEVEEEAAGVHLEANGLQDFIFSATLNKDLLRKLSNSSRRVRNHLGLWYVPPNQSNPSNL